MSGFDRAADLAYWGRPLSGVEGGRAYVCVYEMKRVSVSVLAPMQDQPKSNQFTDDTIKSGASHTSRCRANMANVGQSKPDPGLGFQVKVLRTLKEVPCSLESCLGLRVLGAVARAGLRLRVWR